VPHPGVHERGHVADAVLLPAACGTCVPEIRQPGLHALGGKDYIKLEMCPKDMDAPTNLCWTQN